MAIVIHCFDTDPAPKKGEKGAVISISNDETLGWRVVATAVPSRRNIMRLVSDCPLAVTEALEIHLKVHGWKKVRLAKGSPNPRRIQAKVQAYSEAIPSQYLEDGIQLLAQNFKRRPQKQLPAPPVQYPQAAMQPAAQPQYRPLGATEMPGDLSPEHAQQLSGMTDSRAMQKMQRTQQRYQQVRQRLAQHDAMKAQQAARQAAHHQTTAPGGPIPPPQTISLGPSGFSAAQPPRVEAAPPQSKEEIDELLNEIDAEIAAAEAEAPSPATHNGNGAGQPQLELQAMTKKQLLSLLVENNLPLPAKKSITKPALLAHVVESMM